jgi:uncharacterized protein
MILDTRSIKEGHSAKLQSSDMEAVKESLPPLSGKIECQITLDRNGPMISARIQLYGSFELECARCLATYQQSVSGEIQLILQEDGMRHGAAGEDETADFYFNSHYSQVDISSALFDEIMTSLPLKPLCNDDCKGVIVVREKGSEEGKSAEMECDPRWDALKKLKNDNN